MPKTYLATQSEVAAVEQKADDANTAINAADTGLGALNTTVETIQTTQQADDTRIADLETAVGDASSGLVKSVTDLDTQINEANTGIVARVEDLEQGGTSTTKFRTHSPSGSYEDGEIVLVGRSQYRANNAMDGSTTPIPFVAGSGANEWQPVSVHNKEIEVQLDNGTIETKLTHGGLVSNNATDGIVVGLDPARKRMVIATAGDTAQAALGDNDLLTYSEIKSEIAKYPVGEVLCLCAWEVALSADSAPTITELSTKWSDPTTTGAFAENTNGWDRNTVTVSSWKPTDMTITRGWFEVVGTESDNMYGVSGTPNTNGDDVTVNLYSIDDSDIGSTGDVSLDAATVILKLMVVASA